MESQPQKPEFRNNPENFHPCPQIKCVTENYCLIPEQKLGCG